jgi:hypothetical protein
MLVMLKEVKFKALVAAAGLMLPASIYATALTSPHFRLDPSVGNSFGGIGTSTNYKLVDSGGEGVVGSGSSVSYKLTQGYVAQLSQSITLAVLPNGTVSYYPLDTGLGTVAYDVSTNENRGFFSGTPSWTTGKIGQGISLNGGSQYTDIASNPTLNLTGDLTIEAWVNIPDYANNATIAAKVSGTGSTNNTYEFRIQQTTGRLQLLGFDTVLRTITATSAVPTGSFVHVAAVKSGGNVTLYVNGSSVGVGTIGTTTINTNPLKLGARDDLTNFFKGTLDEVKIYGRGLSTGEVQSNYLAAASSSESAFILPNITPGISQSYVADAIVRTDAGGYSLYIQEDHDLLHSDGVTTIPAVAASITTPASWTEGVTKGLGFSLISGTQLELKWGTNPAYNYAAIPTVPTIFHSRVGLSGGVAEKSSIQFRADTASGQKSGTYTNAVIYTATLKP